jgi:hypothetical protein
MEIKKTLIVNYQGAWMKLHVCNKSSQGNYNIVISKHYFIENSLGVLTPIQESEYLELVK